MTCPDCHRDHRDDPEYDEETGSVLITEETVHWPCMQRFADDLILQALATYILKETP